MTPATSSTRAFEEACDAVADAVRKFAGKSSDETAKAVRSVVVSAHTGYVSAGARGGQWGWTPIQAAMFENAGWHPLFGNERKWYRQPRREFLEEAAEDSADEAMRLYADISIRKWCDQLGYA